LGFEEKGGMFRSASKPSGNGRQGGESKGEKGEIEHRQKVKQAIFLYPLK
jgi:hypothetical protein